MDEWVPRPRTTLLSEVAPVPSNRLTKIAVPIGIVVVVLMMVVPLPAALLDILIA